MDALSESNLEEATLDGLFAGGWEPRAGASVAPGSGERKSWSDLALHDSLEKAARNLNPDVPVEYLQQAINEVLTAQSQDPLAENLRVHEILLEGYRGVTYVDDEGRLATPTIQFYSANPSKNRYLAVNQVTLRDQERERRFDIVLYVNGLPLAVMELKRSGALGTSSEAAYNQLQTYLEEFPMAFRFAALAVASDGVTARYGTPFTPWHHFARWNVDERGEVVDSDYHGEVATELELVVSGVFQTETFGEIFRDFIAFQIHADKVIKRVAKPHQFFAVKKAVESTVEAVQSDGRAGVVWHTQGSGKSMEMELYTAKIMRHPRLANPTVIVITDRTELDTQLFEDFDASTILPEKPQTVATRAELREQLAQRRTGGIYFTTLQKFGLTQDERKAQASHPLLSDRQNIIVIVDEAHRSHYDNIDGYAAHLKSALPNATMIAFTGTPIAEGERDTRRVFGSDIHTYDLLAAVEDGATVPVAFEPRLIKLERAKGVDDKDIDDAAEEATEDLDEADKERLERSVAVLSTVYGAPERLQELAEDLVVHWETRSQSMRPFIGGPGKALVVCATRDIAARLYEEIIALRPDWHSDEDDKGKIKVVYSADPSDPSLIKKHLRRRSANTAVKNRLKDENDPLEIVIVQNMMLTGFDAPPLHTLYLDRPIKGALLMQTLARVNRTFRGKQDGLLVAYAPVAENLSAAMIEWTTETGKQGQGNPGMEAKEAAVVVLEALDALNKLVGPDVGFDWRTIYRSDPKKGPYKAASQVTSYLRNPYSPGNSVPNQPNLRPLADRYKEITGRMARAYAIAGSVEDVQERHPEVRFHEEVRVWLAKLDAQDRVARGEPVPEDVKRLLGDIIITSTESDGVIDIYEKAGLARPQLGALTPQWMEEASSPSKAQLAIEALRVTLMAEMNRVAASNKVRRKQFSQRVNELMTRYTNLQLSAAEVIQELADMAEEVLMEARRGEQFDPPLEVDELAFYDLFSTEDISPEKMDDAEIAQIARELVEAMRRDVRTDWTVREDVKAKMRRNVKRLLRKNKYPHTQASQAVLQVMAAMEDMVPRWTETSG